ncbi:MAG: aminotransferase class III-fold pyridoxal phosphate-dependent enzyme [Bacteroidota bacterium]
MKLFDVYPLFDIEPVRALGSELWDNTGRRYLDLYGGHAVISIGHTHPHYVQRLNEQLNKIAFYSNSVKIPLQEELAKKLGKMSGYEDFDLFLVNSGAEANENALKMASFHTGRKRVLVFKQSFHGRTSLAVEATDNPSIVAPVNRTGNMEFLPLNDIDALTQAFTGEPVAAVMAEGIQGLAGIYEPATEFLEAARTLCTEHGAVLILDEVQSGYGRSGSFFAHQNSGIRPDLITVAKGMGNGFPVGGLLLGPQFQAKHSLLGTTFGGNHLACAAALAVLEVIESENLIDNASKIGLQLASELSGINGVTEVRGTGLMLGAELDRPAGPVRTALLNEFGIFTGSANQKNTIRILPALNLSEAHADEFLTALRKTLA